MGRGTRQVPWNVQPIDDAKGRQLNDEGLLPRSLRGLVSGHDRMMPVHVRARLQV
jgi:hypothetical protein